MPAGLPFLSCCKHGKLRARTGRQRTASRRQALAERFCKQTSTYRSCNYNHGYNSVVNLFKKNVLHNMKTVKAELPMQQSGPPAPPAALPMLPCQSGTLP